MATKRFSPQRNFNKTGTQKVPTNEPIVYKLMNKEGTNIYTGTAKRGRGSERLEDHLPGGQDPIRGARTFQIKQKPSIAEAEKEEKQIIEKEKPKYNK
jgi:excinuclease UvrABC nuclease subunit